MTLEKHSVGMLAILSHSLKFLFLSKFCYFYKVSKKHSVGFIAAFVSFANIDDKYGYFNIVYKNVILPENSDSSNFVPSVRLHFSQMCNKKCISCFTLMFIHLRIEGNGGSGATKLHRFCEK